MKIDIKQYNILQQAYDFFNKELFNNELPEVVFIIDYRKSSIGGYFHFKKLEITKEDMQDHNSVITTISIISLNPDYINREHIDTISTLVHDMCHAWRSYKSEKEPTPGYHDKVWSKKMEAIGLTPSSDGTKTGKKTGVRMHHIIKHDGLFELKAKTFIANKQNIFLFSGIADIKTSRAASSRNKTKYTCSCGEKIYSQPGLNATCNKCNTTFKSYE